MPEKEEEEENLPRIVPPEETHLDRARIRWAKRRQERAAAKAKEAEGQ